MVDPRGHTGSGRRRFASVRRRIYQVFPDVPDEALPLVLALVEQCAAGTDPAVFLASLAIPRASRDA